MNPQLAAFCAVLLPLSVAAQSWFSAELRSVESRITELREQMLPPMLPAEQAPELGYQLYGVTSPPREAPWVQLDLGEKQAVDQIVLIPAAQLMEGTLRPFGFPRRFRVDASETADFATSRVIADFTDEDLPERGLEPFVIQNGGAELRHVRITVPGLFTAGKHSFYALGEVLVLRGELNLAPAAKFSASDARGFLPAWSIVYLKDGKSALGPPMQWSHQKPAWTQNGLTARPDGDVAAFMRLDLGESMTLDEVRLHGMASSVFGSVDMRFPVQMKVSLSETPDLTSAVTLLDGPVSPPKGNTFYLPARSQRGRYLTVSGRGSGGKEELSLSEIEVYVGGKNAARGKPVEVLPQFTGVDRGPEDLTDGRVTHGTLVSLPQWLEQWRVWAAQRDELVLLNARRTTLMQSASQRLWLTLALIGIVLVLAVLWLFHRQRKRREHELATLRDRLASDLHDEIGSSLAGIAMLSQTAASASGLNSAQREDWQEVRRAAEETSQAMREVLWLIGARQEAGAGLLTTLRQCTTRLLRGHECHFEAPEALAHPLEASAARELVLVFKEALANIQRHAPGAAVHVKIDESPLQIEIRDHGPGFDLSKPRNGLGLRSMAKRCQAIGASFSIESTAQGTCITFQLH